MKVGLKRKKVSATCPLQMRATPPPIPITSCVDEGVKYIEYKQKSITRSGLSPSDSRKPRDRKSTLGATQWRPGTVLVIERRRRLD